jgi:choice-of-anchor A domain-containing protein
MPLMQTGPFLPRTGLYFAYVPRQLFDNLVCHMNSTLRNISIALLAGQLLCSSAFATPVSAADALSQFNLIVFDDAVSSSHVDGRTIVGGSLTGGDYVQHPADAPTSGYAGLTVGGNAAGVNVNGLGIVTGGNLANANVNSGASTVLGNASNVNFNGGGAYVGGSATNSNFNGGLSASLPGNAETANDAAALKTEMLDLSKQIALLASTGSDVSIAGNRATFNAVAGVSGVAVFDLSAIDTELFKLGEFEFVLNGATTLIFNIDDSDANIAANFLAGSAKSIAQFALWNFYNADALVVETEFGGTILAPTASFRNENNIEGTVVVGSLLQHGEIHLQPFVGDPPGSVPEPGSVALLLAGLAALTFRRTRTAG